MPLPPFFQRFMKPSTPAAAAPGKGRKASAKGPVEAAAPTAGVEAARVQARRRLVGALVLLLAGIVGFPMLFETQPRPVALDMPIQTPAGVVQVPPPALPATAQRQPLPPSVQAAVEVEVETPLDKAAHAAVQAASAAAQAAPALKAEPKAEVKPEPRVEARPEPKPELKPSAPKAVVEPAKAAASKAVPKPAADDGSRARALLDDKPAAVAAAASAAASSAKAGRFVVQVGAYTEAGALREARQKVEKLGLKTYTQVIEGDAGKRTRVRVGPFETREEAERTAARVKAQGLPTAILAL